MANGNHLVSLRNGQKKKHWSRTKCEAPHFGKRQVAIGKKRGQKSEESPSLHLMKQYDGCIKSSQGKEAASVAILVLITKYYTFAIGQVAPSIPISLGDYHCPLLKPLAQDRSLKKKRKAQGKGLLLFTFNICSQIYVAKIPAKVFNLVMLTIGDSLLNSLLEIKIFFNHKSSHSMVQLKN